MPERFKQKKSLTLLRLGNHHAQNVGKILSNNIFLKNPMMIFQISESKPRPTFSFTDFLEEITSAFSFLSLFEKQQGT
jgi:hypothetical protein